MALSERNNNKMPGDYDSRTLNLKDADIHNNVRATVLTRNNIASSVVKGSVFHNPSTGSV